MPIAVLFLFASGAVAIAVLHPHLRKPALVVVALFVALFASYFLLPASETERRATRISVEQIALSDVDLIIDSRFLKLVGRVTNQSTAYHLRSFEIEVTQFDCPAEDIPHEECAIVGQDVSTARVDIPGGQTRDFSALLDLRDSASIIGFPVWDYQITGSLATE